MLTSLLKAFRAFVKLSFLCCLLVFTVQAQSDLKPLQLRVEYKTNPFIDAAQPRFSWELQSAVNNQKQTARQILVAGSVVLLSEGKADAWNSGKIGSDATSQVEYEGKPLTSNKTYYWKVRSWDKDGNPGPWSEPAYFSTGLLRQSDWKAEWIGYDVNALSVSKKYHLPPCPYLRKEATVNGTIKKANLYVTALGLYEFYINGARIGDE